MHIWLNGGGHKGCSDNPNQTTANNNGGFLLEVPAGAYEIHGCTYNGGRHGGESIIVISEEVTYVERLELSPAGCPTGCW